MSLTIKYEGGYVKIFLIEKPEYPIIARVFLSITDLSPGQDRKWRENLRITAPRPQQTKISAETPFHYHLRPKSRSVTKGIRPSTGEKISCVAALFLRGSFIPIIPE